MNTELRLDHPITGSKKHGKSAKDIRFTDLVKLLDMPETASGSNVQSKLNTCYGTYNSKTRQGMNILNAQNRSPLLIMSKKGSEDMMAPM